MPSWSEMKNRSRPSGENCGLMCLPCTNGDSTVILPDARSYVASSRGEYLRVVKSVAGPRSVEKAIVLPSGDQVGWMSAYLSLVSWRIAPLARSITYRSLMPPACPEKASDRPSGDHETWLTDPIPGSLIRRSTFVDRVFRIAISFAP